jgi:hypothetical protein
MNYYVKSFFCINEINTKILIFNQKPIILYKSNLYKATEISVFLAAKTRQAKLNKPNKHNNLTYLSVFLLLSSLIKGF